MTTVLPDLSRRLEARELMDSGGLPEAELARALRFLEACNRWLGGWAVLEASLRAWSRSWEPGETITLLDVGTGAGDLPRRAQEWARERGFELRATGIDSDPEVFALARRACAGSDVELIESGLAEFAASGRRFDYVCASLVLHHVPEAQTEDALRACASLARRGLLISDLRRCAAGYLGVSALTAFLGDRVTRHDGPLSVRRAFTERELAELAARAGLPWLAVRREPFFRLSLSGARP